MIVVTWSVDSRRPAPDRAAGTFGRPSLPASPLQLAFKAEHRRHTQRLSVPLNCLVPAAGREFPTVAGIPPQAEESLKLLAGLVARLPPVVAPADKDGLWMVLVGEGLVGVLRAYVPLEDWTIKVPCFKAPTSWDPLPVEDGQLLATFLGRISTHLGRRVRRQLRERGFPLEKLTREQLALLATAWRVK